MSENRFKSLNKGDVKEAKILDIMNKKTVKLTVELPCEIHKDLKMAAASKSVNMRDILIVVIKEYLKKNPL